mgnify:CR=1 FL=1|tara:strand:+ start:2868 stop:3665 length:798 start_codon:yes stop_codon:yes gene_type:complete
MLRLEKKLKTQNILAVNNIPIKIHPTRKEYATLLKLYPPVLANKFLPDWYKKQTSYKRGDVNTSNLSNAWQFRSAKKCPAIRETITQGIVIPAWTDVNIVKNDNQWNYETGIGSYDNTFHTMDFQHYTQIQHMDLNVIEGHGILKLISPYWFVTPKGYGLEFQDPFYHIRKNIKLLPGKVETDIWHTVNFPFEFYEDINKLEKGHVFVKAGDPLLICNLYKKEKNKIDLQLNEYDEKFYDDVIEEQKLSLFSQGQNWIDYKEKSE